MQSEGNATAGPKSGINSFADAVGVVERAFRFRSRYNQEEYTSSSSRRTSQINTTFTVDPSTLSLDLESGFPRISDEKLSALFPGKGGEEVRKCVKLALDEMELNFKLDPRSLGEPSESNKGHRAIADLLSRIEIVQDGRNPQGIAGKEGLDGHTSGRSEGDSRDGKGGGGSRASGSGQRGGGTVLSPPRTYETHDLLKAIDRKDAETIIAIRDANFDLLLDLSQGGKKPSAPSTAVSGASSGSSNTPLGYCIGLGKGWEGISIVLIGAISKFINNLPEEDEASFDTSSLPALAPGQGIGHARTKKPKKVELDPRTLTRLRKIRVNLKLAIDHSISTDQTRLLASYLQTLVMSEGSHFIRSSTEAVQHAIRTSVASRQSLTRASQATSDGSATKSASSSDTPDAVSLARSFVLQFVTDSLKHKKDRVAAVKDYVSNATGDLILMALWQCVKLHANELGDLSGSEIQDDPDLIHELPIYFFARDDRITVAFTERIDSLHKLLESRKGNVGGGGGNQRGARSPWIWKLSKSIVEEIRAGTRRLNSIERLAIVEGKLGSI
ncbi:hypothetical protein IE53DRAFT_362308 [Violaceomyces palustris]|uniref:Uncharacterized protein n=1 Tax=Violaceomyces palustris TaxID=1673888 RepID=A0ACD0NXT1_9BASI|nr:hypothetical protein IE53DRAFT_362308 [Violaceomyces palustris]